MISYTYDVLYRHYVDCIIYTEDSGSELSWSIHHFCIPISDRAGCETGARACPNLANAAEDRTNSTEGRPRVLGPHGVWEKTQIVRILGTCGEF